MRLYYEQGPHATKKMPRSLAIDHAVGVEISGTVCARAPLDEKFAQILAIHFTVAIEILQDIRKGIDRKQCFRRRPSRVRGSDRVCFCRWPRPQEWEENR